MYSLTAFDKRYSCYNPSANHFESVFDRPFHSVQHDEPYKKKLTCHSQLINEKPCRKNEFSANFCFHLNVFFCFLMCVKVMNIIIFIIMMMQHAIIYCVSFFSVF